MKTVKVEHLEEIGVQHKKLLSEGDLDGQFYEDRLSAFSYDYQKAMKNAKTMKKG